MAPTRKLAELFFDLRARTEGLQKDVSTAERQMGRLTSFVLKNPVTALAAVGTAAAGAALAAVRMASEIETSMRRVQSSTAGGAEGIKALQRDIAQLSRDTGVAQAELARAAELAAKSSSSTSETGTRLRAATLAAVATGDDVTGLLEGLDQALDLFNRSGAESEQVLAELFAAAQGRQGLQDLFAELKAAAPAIQQLNLDLPTAARALVALGESGLSPKQAASALKELAGAGERGREEVERLAETIPRAGAPMTVLANAAQNAANSTENLNKRIKAELNATLIELGNVLLPTVNKGLQGLLRFVSGISTVRQATEALGKDLPEGFGKLDLQSKVAVSAANNVTRAIDVLAAQAKAGGASFRELGEEGLSTLLVQLGQLQKGAGPELVSKLNAVRGAAVAALQAIQTAGKEGGTAGRATAPLLSDEELAKANKKAVDALKELSGDFAAERDRAIAEANKTLGELAEKQRERRIALAEALIDTGRATTETLAQLMKDLEDQLVAQGSTRGEAETILEARFGFKSARAQLQGMQKDLREILNTGLKELNDGVDEANKKRAKEAKGAEENADTALARAQRVGRQIEDIGRLTLAASDAFGVLSDEASKALSAVIDVGAGIGRIASGDLVGGLTQGIAGVISLAGQAFGKDPAAEQRRKEHQENLQALRGIQKNTGDLLGISTSGRDIAGITSGIEALLGRSGGAGGFRKFSELGINEAGLLEGITGKSFKEIEALAKSLGITLNGTKQSYLDFLTALKSLDLEAFSEGFAGKIRQLEIEAKLDPAAFEGIEGLIKRLKILAGPDGAPAIAKALEGLDLSTSEGRAKAITELTDTLRNIGKLKPEDLGGLSLDQFIAEILATIEGLRAAQPAVETAGEKLRAALAELRESFEALDIDSIEEQTKKLAELLETIAPAFAGVTEGLDTASLDSIEAADARLKELFERREALTEAERGGLSLEEFTAALLELDRALDASREKLTGERQKRLDDAKRAEEDRLAALSDAERAAEEERAKRVRERIEKARRESEILDEGPEASLARLVEALGDLSPALGGLLDGLDLSNPADILTLNERIRELFESMGEGSEGLGQLSLAEFLEQLLALDGSTDGLIEALSRLGGAVATVAEQINAALSALELDLDIAGITDPIERLKRTAETVGGVEKSIREALDGIDLSSAEGRKKAEQALQALAVGANTDLKQIILRLLEQIRGVPTEDVPGGDLLGGGTSTGSASSREALATAQAVTEVTANRWLDLMTTDVVLSRERNAILQQIFGSLSTRSGPILPPAIAFPTTTGAERTDASGVVIRFEVGGINFNGPLTVGDADELGRLMQRRVLEVLNGPVLSDLINAIQRAGLVRAGGVS